MKEFDFLVVGLGNPGEEYANTRHNAGFLALEEARIKWEADPWKELTKVGAEITEAELAGKRGYLLRPLGFMNKSGAVLKSFLNYYKIEPKEALQKLVVVYDDSDLTEGQIKITGKGGGAGHKGLQNILEQLGTEEVTRVKLGIRPQHNQEKAEVFVLKDFSGESGLAERIKEMPEVLGCLILGGLDSCQDRYN